MDAVDRTLEQISQRMRTIRLQQGTAYRAGAEEHLRRPDRIADFLGRVGLGTMAHDRDAAIAALRDRIRRHLPRTHRDVADRQLYLALRWLRLRERALAHTPEHPR